MNVYTCTDGSNYIPAGPALVIVAKDEAQARQLLDAALEERGIKPHIAEKYALGLLNTSQVGTYILYEGG